MPAYFLDHKGTRHPLNRPESVLGRSEDCAIYLPHSQVSRIHAVIRLRSDDTLELVDLGSMNGTRLNGERLLGPRKLHNGDVIRIGTELLTVRVDETGEAPSVGTGLAPATTTRPSEGERGVIDSLELAEALVKGGETTDRRDAAARTVRSLLDQMLGRIARERLSLERELAERIAALVEQVSKLSPTTATTEWVDKVAGQVRVLLDR